MSDYQSLQVHVPRHVLIMVAEMKRAKKQSRGDVVVDAITEAYRKYKKSAEKQKVIRVGE